jgi:hypothetical protein
MFRTIACLCRQSQLLDRTHGFVCTHGWSLELYVLIATVVHPSALSANLISIFQSYISLPYK